MKAFARIDGAWLALLLIAGFTCYVVGLTSPLYGFLAMITLLVVPFFVGRRLKRFRDDGLDGTMSFLRGWAYVILMFFYGGLLFALAQYAYLTYMDKGYILTTITDVLSAPESVAVMKQMGMDEQVNESLHLLGTMRPIDFALDMLTTLIMAGAVLGLPIAAIVKRTRPLTQ